MATFTADFLRFPTGNEPIIELVERSDLKLELELDSLTEQEPVEDSPESEVGSVVSEIANFHRSGNEISGAKAIKMVIRF